MKDKDKFNYFDIEWKQQRKIYSTEKYLYNDVSHFAVLEETRKLWKNPILTTFWIHQIHEILTYNALKVGFQAM